METPRGTLPKSLARGAAALLLLLASGCVVEREAPRPSPPVRVEFLDVGQGDAALLSFEGRHWMVDAGSAGRGLPSRLAARGVDSLAGIFVTHHHEDHYGGVAELLRAFPAGRVYVSGDPLRSAAWSALEEEIARGGLGPDTLWRGDWIPMGRGDAAADVGVRVLWPHHGVRAEGNDASLALQVVSPGARALLTGDAGSAVEAELARLEGGRLRSELLKAGHHGSATSSSVAFLAAVRPLLAAVSVGLGNDYGHPAPEVLADLALVLGDSSRILRTDRLSDLAFELGEGGLSAEGREPEGWARW